MEKSRQTFQEFKKDFNNNDEIKLYELYLETVKFSEGRREDYFKKFIDAIIGTSPILVAILGGLVTYGITNATNNSTAQSQLQLKNKELASDLIINAVKDKSSAQIAANLKVLQIANLIDSSINISQLSKLAYSEKLDSLSRLTDSINKVRNEYTHLASLSSGLSKRNKELTIEGQRLHAIYNTTERLAYDANKRLIESQENFKHLSKAADSLKRIVGAFDNILASNKSNPNLAINELEKLLNVSNGYIKQQQQQQQVQQQQQQKIYYDQQRQQQQQQQQKQSYSRH